MKGYALRGISYLAIPPISTAGRDARISGVHITNCALFGVSRQELLKYRYFGSPVPSITSPALTPCGIPVP